MTATQLLEKIREHIEATEITADSANLNAEELVTKYAIPALNNLKEIQSGLYQDYFLNDKGLSSKLKNKVIRKIANVSRNTVELSLMRQQKFNDNVTAVLEYLFAENSKLKQKITELEKAKG